MGVSLDSLDLLSILIRNIETGGMFRLLTRLMTAESGHADKFDLDVLCRLLGRYFQIRDDYKNLYIR